jgi:hypothetical protein
MRLGAELISLIAMLIAGCSSSPGFEVSHHEVDAPTGGKSLGVFWRITNTAESPLIVNRVVFNGEHDAPLADTGPYLAKVADRLPPVTLTIGESGDFLQWSFTEDPHAVAQNRAFINELAGKKPEPVTDTGKVYRKVVIYIDIETNRGKFRYRPAESRFEKSY